MTNTLSWRRLTGTVRVDPTVSATAAQQTAEAAAHADVTLRSASSLADVRAATALFDATWPEPNGAGPVLPGLAWAMVHAGNHLGIAERGGQVVGATLAFRAADAAGPTVHSHLAAVGPDTRTRHIGYALKQQQRAWALAQGIRRMTWTYDPLVARNGYFNLAKLGATAVSYYPDFYGVMADRMNVGTASDRCLVEWRLAEARARNAADGRPQLIDVVALRNADTPVLLWVGPDGQPVSPDSERTWHSSPSALLAQVPADIVALRVDDPALAAHWRSALADVLGRAFATGHHLIGADRDGWHLLGRT